MLFCRSTEISPNQVICWHRLWLSPLHVTVGTSPLFLPFLNHRTSNFPARDGIDDSCWNVPKIPHNAEYQGKKDEDNDQIPQLETCIEQLQYYPIGTYRKSVPPRPREEKSPRLVCTWLAKYHILIVVLQFHHCMQVCPC